MLKLKCTWDTKLLGVQANKCLMDTPSFIQLLGHLENGCPNILVSGTLIKVSMLHFVIWCPTALGVYMLSKLASYIHASLDS